MAGFVHGMSTAHRQEVLDDFLMDSNWKKLIGMPHFLTSKLDCAQVGFMAAKQTFKELSTSVGEKWVCKWGRLERLAFSKGGVGNRIYKAAEMRSMCFISQHNPLTQCLEEGLAEASLHLTKLELVKGGDLSGTIDWLVRGFALEQAQYVF